MVVFEIELLSRKISYLVRRIVSGQGWDHCESVLSVSSILGRETKYPLLLFYNPIPIGSIFLGQKEL